MTNDSKLRSFRSSVADACRVRHSSSTYFLVASAIHCVFFHITNVVEHAPASCSFVLRGFCRAVLVPFLWQPSCGLFLRYMLLTLRHVTFNFRAEVMINCETIIAIMVLLEDCLQRYGPGCFQPTHCYGQKNTISTTFPSPYPRLSGQIVRDHLLAARRKARAQYR